MGAMKIRIIVLLALLAAGLSSVFADNTPQTSQPPQATETQTTGGTPLAPQPGFGLQATIFDRVRNPNTNLMSNVSLLATYPLTPGDIYTLTLGTGAAPELGNTSQSVLTFTLQLSQDMKLDVPYLGTIDVKGMTLPELKRKIIDGVRRSIPVQYVNFLLTSPAEFNVFIYGGVNAPGYIVANPLDTVIDAIGLAKGFKPGASYRNIELIHDGKTESLDISKFYTEADFSANPRLKPGDEIYVPPAQIVATIAGKVAFPGTYELLPTESLATLIRFAGGFTPGALTSRISIERIDSEGVHHLIDVSDTEAGTTKILMGDAVNVPSTTQNAEVVSIEGAIFGKLRSGETPIIVPREPVRVDIPFFPGITLLNVLDEVGGPTPFAIAHKSYLIEPSGGKHVPLPVDKLWKTRDPALDRRLYPGDHVVIPMETLKVFVTGAVLTPGAVPYQPDLTVEQYLLFAGGINEKLADLNAIYSISGNGQRVKLSLTQTVTPGTAIYVSTKPLLVINEHVQNFFLITGWVTTVVGVLGTVLSFWLSYGPALSNLFK